MVLSLLLWLVTREQLSLWQAGGLVAVFLLVLVGFAAATKRFGTAAFLIFVAWLVTGIASYVASALGGAAVTHLLPFGLVAVAVWMWRAIALASGIPFLLSVALVVVFLPLLTEDLWTVGQAIRWQLFAVAAVALGPLLLVLGIRYARIDVEEEFLTAAERLKELAAPEKEATRLVTEAASETLPTEILSDDALRSALAPGYRSSNVKRVASGIGRDMRPTFRRQTLLRFGRLVIGVGASFAAFVYLLAWAAIPISTSSEWIGRAVSTVTVDFAGWQLALPTTPYISVAVLLSIVATAAFLAFALTEDRYSTALLDVLVREPARRCVLLGVPYRSFVAETEPTSNGRPELKAA